MLSGASACKNIVRAALRYDTALTTARSNCLPLISLVTGYAGRCGGSVAAVSGRYGMMEQVSLTWAENQIDRLTFQAQMLTLATATTFVAPTDAAILAAGGDPYSWHDNAIALTTAGVETGGLDNVLNSITLTIANAIQRDGTRGRDALGAMLPDSNPLARCAFGLVAMSQTITLDVNAKNLTPYFDGMTITMGAGPNATTYTLGGVVLNQAAQDETPADGRFGFPSSYMVSTMTVV